MVTRHLHVKDALEFSDTSKIEKVEYYLSLLKLGEKNYNDGLFSASVIVAHVACEMAVEFSLTMLIEQNHSPQEVQAILNLFMGFNIANDRIRELFTAFSNCDIKNEVFWEEFKKSTKRRNDVAHRWYQPTKDEAKATLDTARQVVKFVTTKASQQCLSSEIRKAIKETDA